MSSKVHFVSGEPIEVRDSTTAFDTLTEGSIRHSTATDADGNEYEAGGRTQEAADGNAIFGLFKNRGDD